MSESLFLDTSGNVRPVAPEDVPGAHQLGWTPATPKQIEEFQIQQKYGTPIEGAKAFGEHAASAATLGLSDIAERASGLTTPEAMAGREQANPGLSTAGTVAGIAGPLLTPAGPLKAAAELTAPSLISRAGSAVTRALRPEASSVAGRILASGAAHAAGSAVEGAFYGLGQVVHEAALGDPELTGQNALTTIGLTAALGGGLGAVAGVGATGISESADAARKALGGLSDAVATPEKLAGAVQEHYDAMGQATRTASQILRPEETAALIRQAPETAQGELIRVTSRIDEAINAMRARPELHPQPMYMAKLEDIRDSLIPHGLTELPDSSPVEVFNAIDNAKRVLDKQLGKWGRMIPPEQQDSVAAVRAVRGELKASLENPAVWGDAAARQAAYNGKLSDWLGARTDFEKEFMIKKPGKRVTPDFTADAGDLARLSNSANPKTPQRQAILKHYLGTSASLLDEMEEAAKHAPSTGFDPDALRSLVDKTGDIAQKQARQGAFLRMLSNLSGAAPMGAVVGSMAGGPLGMAIGAGVDIASKAAKYVPRAVDALAHFERNNTAVAGSLKKAAAALVKTAAPVGKAEATAGLSHVFTLPTDELRTAYEKRVARVASLAQNPEQMHHVLMEQTSDWHDHAPKTAQALNAATARAVAFLASKIPQAPQRGPLSPEWKPSHEAMARFMRYAEALEMKPGKVLEHVARGTLTREGLEALQTAAPAVLTAARAAVLEALAGKGDVPYQSRHSISRFMGSDMDGSTRAALAQQSFALPPMGPKPPKFGSMKSAQRAQTPMQQAAGWEVK